MTSAPLSKFPLAGLVLALAIASMSGCTIYADKPPKTAAEATGGEGLEKIFWKNVQAANWTEVDRSIASNYAGVAAEGKLDHASALQQYKNWQVKDFAIGDLQTELNGPTLVVTYTITLSGTAGQAGSDARALPSAPQHMMTVWQQQKKGWIIIAHSSTL